VTNQSTTHVAAAPKRSRRAKPAGSRPTGPVRPLILGILNVTPDSFSDGGAHGSVGAAVEYAAHMRECGADIIDVGGESTRPGSERLPIDEEQRRVLPVLDELATRRIPFSIDTMNARTAAAAAERGAAIINDVSGGTADADMARVAAETGLMFIAMHSRGPSEARTAYRDVIGEVRLELEYRIAALIMQGVTPGRSSSTRESASRRTPRRTGSCSAVSASCAPSATPSWSARPASDSSASCFPRVQSPASGTRPPP